MLQSREMIAGGVGHEPGRVVAIAVVVAVALEVAAREIVERRHADHAAEQVRPAEELVRRMEAAEARTRRQDPFRRVAADMPDVRHHVILDILRVGGLSARLHRHGQVTIHPALPVDAVDGEQPQPPCHEQWLDGLHQEKALVLEVVRCSGGIEQHRRAGMAIRHDGHVHADGVRVPAMTMAWKLRVDELHGWGLVWFRHGRRGDAPPAGTSTRTHDAPSPCAPAHGIAHRLSQPARSRYSLHASW